MNEGQIPIESELIISNNIPYSANIHHQQILVYLDCIGKRRFKSL
jgi:hypothetical protein